MKTTLVYPGIAGYGFKSVGKGMEAGWISHGLAHLSASAKDKGFEVDLIDLRALTGWDHFRQEILERKPDVVGITMMSVDYNPAMQCLQIIKEVAPKTITVVGGPHPTLALDETAEIDEIDYIITHEGEITFPKLLDAIEQGNPPAERILTGECPDLDALPFPDRDLFLNEWRKFGYTSDSPEDPFVPELPPPFVTIIAGRGCKYNCSFCQPAERRIFGRGVRRRSPANIVQELEQLREKYGFNGLMFHDDTLTEEKDWVVEFCHLYREHGFTQPFFCQNRADIIVRHQDMVQLMAETGCKGYFIGFESGSDRMLKFLRKGTTREVNLEAARVCRKFGIKIWANYMLGLPTETKEEVAETISMLQEIDPDYYSPAFYTPHPGSDLYDYCLENDLSLITSHDQYRRNPTEVKIKGQDYEYLQWALQESQRRKPINQFKRSAARFWQRARRATPKKVVHKVAQLVSGQDR